MGKNNIVVGSILQSKKNVHAGRSSTVEVLAIYDDAVRVRHIDGIKKGVHILNMHTLRRYEVVPAGQLPLPQGNVQSKDDARIADLEKRVLELETRLSNVADLYKIVFRGGKKTSTSA